jgi:microcystin-dependent protein
MTQPFLGEVQVFAFNYAPYGWSLCNGQIMPVQQNTALFSLLGTTYGGNGSSTFGLPNLQGQAACSTGQGPGLQNYDLGEIFGQENVTLAQSEMPMHNHTAHVYNQPTAANRFGSPGSGYALDIPANFGPFTSTNTVGGSFPGTMIMPNSGGQPHSNQQPYLALNFCIALSGVFPQRP